MDQRYFQDRDFTGKWILLSDVDGTLVDHSMVVSDKDGAAIEAFTQAGHYFSLATGRGRTNAEFHLKNLATNFPAIYGNGTLLYDREQDQVIEELTMPTEGLAPLFDRLLDYYPDLMIQLYTRDDIYLVTDSPADDPRVSNHQPYERVAFEKIRGIYCNKVLFGFQPENADGGKAIADEFVTEHLPDLRAVKSQKRYVELTPAGVSKGSMVKLVQAATGTRVAVAGDYFNDLEMMRQADLSFTLKIAPAEVRESADRVLEAGPGDFIAQIIEVLLKEASQS